MSILFDMLKQENFLIVNKLLIQSIGLDEAILFSELVSKYDYYKNQNKLNADGSFYATIDDIEMSTGLKEKTQAKAIKNLKVLKFIDVKVKGIPAKRHFYINPDENLLKKYLEEGKIKLQQYYNKNTTNIDNLTVTRKSETSLDNKKINEVANNISPSTQVSTFGETGYDKSEDLSREKAKQDCPKDEEIIYNKLNLNNNITTTTKETSNDVVDAISKIKAYYQEYLGQSLNPKQTEIINHFLSKTSMNVVLTAIDSAALNANKSPFAYIQKLVETWIVAGVTDTTRVKKYNEDYKTKLTFNARENQKSKFNKNKFMNFKQTKYDFAEIERMEMERTLEEIKKMNKE